MRVAVDFRAASAALDARRRIGQCKLTCPDHVCSGPLVQDCHHEALSNLLIYVPVILSEGASVPVARLFRQPQV